MKNIFLKISFETQLFFRTLFFNNKVNQMYKAVKLIIFTLAIIKLIANST